MPRMQGCSPPYKENTVKNEIPRTTVRLRSGNEMPVLGIGTWQLTRDTPGAIESALELGYPMIDTSGDYGTQPGIAEGIRRHGADRASLYIVTKVEETDDAYAKTREDLGELKLDYADLMLIHRPPDDGVGEELWRGLMRAKEEGLTRDIGVSNYSMEQIDRLAEKTGEMPAVNQIEWSPFGYSEDMLDYARQNDMIIQAYSPLTRARRLDDPRLSGIADHYGKSPAQLLIRWDMQMGAVPLPKANRRDHQEEDIAVFDFEISDEDMGYLCALNERYSSLGSLPY